METFAEFYMGVSHNQGCHFGGPSKDCSILGSIVGPPYLGKLPYKLAAGSLVPVSSHIFMQLRLRIRALGPASQGLGPVRQEPVQPRMDVLKTTAIIVLTFHVVIVRILAFLLVLLLSAFFHPQLRVWTRCSSHRIKRM